jgi:hypothetical protein
MDLNCLTWVVSLVVAEQRRLASTLIGHMDFYELRSAMEPPHLVIRPRKVVGGGRASIAHVATQDRVFPHYVPNSSIKHNKSDSKDRSQEIL